MSRIGRHVSRVECHDVTRPGQSINIKSRERKTSLQSVVCSWSGQVAGDQCGGGGDGGTWGHLHAATTVAVNICNPPQFSCVLILLSVSPAANLRRGDRTFT